jgi:hypothetical protein
VATRVPQLETAGPSADTDVLFLVLAIHGAVVWLRSQIDLRRTLDVPWWRLAASPSQTLDAIRGRDTFRPNDPTQVRT